MVNSQPSQQGARRADEYELVPHDQLEYLRGEVEKVKRNPFGDSQSSKDLLTSLDHLNKNVSKLVAIFETANDEIVRDYKDKANTEKINKVLEQNEKLAKGIVVIADLLKELKEFRGEQQAREQQYTPPPPPSAEPQRPPQAAPLAPQWQQAMGKLSNDGLESAAAGNQNPFLEEQPPSRPGPNPEQQSQGQRQRPPIDFSDVPPPPPR